MAKPKVILIAAPELIPALRERRGRRRPGADVRGLGPGPRHEGGLGGAAARRSRSSGCSPRARAEPPSSLASRATRASTARRSASCRTTPTTGASRPADARPRRGKPAAKPAEPFDTGTRRWKRFRMKESAVVDGQRPGRPCRSDLSAGGARLVGPEPLRARQRASVG
ncbi:MAG: hypothetical protein MZU79_00750, partial [Anaerotruncus sp.]|nr:hypothetical protein [Anaerotruncus sp.]